MKSHDEEHHARMRAVVDAIVSALAPELRRDLSVIVSVHHQGECDAAPEGDRPKICLIYATTDGLTDTMFHVGALAATIHRNLRRGSA